jgi:flagellar biosynthesis/type III secretory pathway M-ring protein FliF/YscJ
MNNELQLYDIYEHWHVPFWQTPWFFWMATGCGIAVLVGISIWFLKKYYTGKVLSPGQEALERLKQLQKKGITTREDAQEAYFAITAILKKFFQAHYRLPFVGMSDRELIAALRNAGLPPEHIEKLEAVVDESVMVKYARQDALQENVSRAITESIYLITHALAPVTSTR